MRILITGAAGSGTSTLARVLGAAVSGRVFEADDYFWLPSSPPFTTKRDPQDRLSSLLHDLDRMHTAVIAGSIVDWGVELEDSLSIIVFLTVPTAIRVERLRRREELLFGHANPEFLEWAAQYDNGRLPGRSRLKHERWLASRSAPIGSDRWRHFGRGRHHPGAECPQQLVVRASMSTGPRANIGSSPHTHSHPYRRNSANPLSETACRLGTWRSADLGWHSGPWMDIL